jgi:phosphate uptake regulator
VTGSLCDSTLRFFERVADHATNVAAMVIYRIDGTMVRHTLA